MATKAQPTRASRPPATLSPPARKLWSTIATEYDIGDIGGRTILSQAMEAYDRMKQAQEILGREGLLVEDRYGIKKPHPCTGIERDMRAQLLGALKMLNLDIEPLQRVGRPAGLPAKLRIV